MTPTRGQWISLVAAVAFLGATAGFAFGTNAAKPARPGASSVDVGFLQDMASHHEQAIRLSLLELRRGEVADVKSFAEEIHYAQGYEIGAMERQLDEWGRSRRGPTTRAMAWMGHAMKVDAMPGMASDAEFDALASATGREADALFIRLMQDHHRGGVDMAEYAATHASDTFVRDIAARMARIQKTEIAEMEAARQRADLNPNPEGWTSGPFDMVMGEDSPNH